MGPNCCSKPKVIIKILIYRGIHETTTFDFLFRPLKTDFQHFVTIEYYSNGPNCCPKLKVIIKILIFSGIHEISTFDFLFRPLKTDFRPVAALCDY